MEDKREFRELALTEIRADDASGEIEGYAAVFDQEAPIYDFREVIRRGAFKKTIKDGADVFAFWNHDTGTILGRTKNGTLTLREDDHGLRVSFTPPATPRAQEVREWIRAGLVDKMSFGFEVVKQLWNRRDGEPDQREITEVRLFEVSPVSIAAYEGTSVTARGYRPIRAVEEAEHKSEDHGAGAVPSVDTPLEGSADTLLRKLNLRVREG